jgi:trehalose transport system permease protein
MSTVSAAKGPARVDLLERPLKVVFPLWVIGSVLLVAFPLYLVFLVSFAPGSALFGETPKLFFTDFTARWWKRVIEGGDLVSPLIKSLTVASVTTLLAIVIAAPAAYVIARLRPALRYTIVIGLLVTRMFPEFAIGISVATRFAGWGLVDTYLGLILAHLIGTLPFITWILVGTFETVPIDLEEAAQLDGASRMRTLLRVVFPVAAGGSRSPPCSCGCTPGTSSCTPACSPRTRTPSRCKCSKRSTGGAPSRWPPWLPSSPCRSCWSCTSCSGICVPAR